MPTINVPDDIYASVLQISLELAQKEQRRVSMGETIRMLITFCPAVDKAKLTKLTRLY